MMIVKCAKFWLLAVLLQWLAVHFSPAAVIEKDICVYGGTAGGVAAAVQSARLGKSVVLIEPGKHIGGMTSGGLGATDLGDKGSSAVSVASFSNASLGIPWMMRENLMPVK